ncbi:MAG: hypothetical protein FJZ90_18865 [Chloroflexi bacterium]|nr:hypothetical protein [Chloroflexota bacterium]
MVSRRSPSHKAPLPLAARCGVRYTLTRVIISAVRWAAPIAGPYADLSRCDRYDPIEKVIIEE